MHQRRTIKNNINNNIIYISKTDIGDDFKTSYHSHTNAEILLITKGEGLIISKEKQYPIKEKNLDEKIDLVLSNSAIYGLISQTDFFDKDIANKENTSRYYIITKGDFVYNPRKSIYAPYGPVNILEKYF